MFTKAFFSDLLERAIRAAAWAALALFGAGQSGVVTSVDWAAVGTVAAYAAVASALASLAGTQMGAKDSGSFLPAKLDPPKRKPRKDGGYVSLLVVVLIVVLVLVLIGALR